MTQAQQLTEFALAHYEEGGHWIVECWDTADYAVELDKCAGDVERAQKSIQRQWEFINQQAQECAWAGPEG